MTDIKEQIRQLEEIADDNRSDGTTWHDGRINAAKQALVIIRELEEALDKSNSKLDKIARIISRPDEHSYFESPENQCIKEEVPF